MSRARYPKGHTFSPSVLTTIMVCMLKHWFKKVRRFEDPSGPQAMIGKLVHRVLEVAALRRTAPEPGTEPAPPIAGVAELLDILSDEQSGQGGWVIKASREILEAAAPMNFEYTVGAEELIEQFDIGDGLTVGGIVDRADSWLDESGNRHAVITDYKTGQILPADELAVSPQTVIYLAWGAERFGIDDERLALQYYWPGEDVRMTFRYDAEFVADGLASAKAVWRDWAAGGYDLETQPPATLGSHCKHCPFAGDCDQWQEHVKTPGRVEPWEGLDLPALAERYYQVAGDAKMFDAARKQIGALMVEKLDTIRGKQWGKGDDGAAYVAKLQRDDMLSYSIAVVSALANATGLEIEDVMRSVCSLSTTKVRAFVGRHADEFPRVRKVAEIYSTPSKKSAFVKVRAKTGLF